MASPVQNLRSDTEQRIRRLREIPPLADDTRRLLDALSDDDIALRALADVVESVPPLAARIVGIARSAYFGVGASVTSVSDAIIRVLGIRLVRSLSISIALGTAFRHDRCPRFDAEHYWTSAFATATLARALAPHAASSPDPDTAYLCGLLHNLGLLVLAHTVPEAFDDALAVVERDPGRPLRDAELELLGTTHCEAGALLGNSWRLPPEVIAAAAHHPDAHHGGDHRVVVHIVGISHSWAEQRILGVQTPWLSPERVQSIHLAPVALEQAIEGVDRRLEDVAGLGRLVANGN